MEEGKEQNRISNGISAILFLKLVGEFMCLHVYYISLFRYTS